MMFKLIALDVDGTLITPRFGLSSRLLASIKLLQAEDVSIVLSTGRQYQGIKQLIDIFKLKSPQIVVGGALAIDPSTMGYLYAEPLEPMVSQEILGYCEREKITAIASLGVKSVAVGPLDRLIALPDWGLPVPTHYKASRVKSSCYGITLIGVSEINNLMALNGFVSCIGSSVKVSSSAPGFIDLLNNKVSKGNALYHVAKYLGVSKDAIVAIGDSDNDLSMFEVAGYGVAVANASPALQSAAHRVVSCCDDDGAAEAIEELVLSSI